MTRKRAQVRTEQTHNAACFPGLFCLPMEIEAATFGGGRLRYVAILWAARSWPVSTFHREMPPDWLWADLCHNRPLAGNKPRPMILEPRRKLIFSPTSDNARKSLERLKFTDIFRLRIWIIWVPSIEKTGTAGPKQSFDLLDRFNDPGLASLKLVLQFNKC
jgi:hypothetical protein